MSPVNGGELLYFDESTQSYQKVVTWKSSSEVEKVVDGLDG